MHRPLLVVAGLSLLAAAPGPAQDARPRFRARVDLVEVDVVATDDSGRPVLDLRKEEFELLEDGQPRGIASLSLVNLPIDPPHPVAAPDVTTNDRAEQGRLFFLILDDVHTLGDRTDSIKAVARRLLERLGPTDRVAVAWLSLEAQGAREFTNNHAVVLDAIEGMKAQGSRVARRNPGEAGLPDFRDPDDRPADATRDLAGRDVKAVFEKARPFTMVADVCRYLASLPHRRKTIVYVGDGPPGVAFRESPAAEEASTAGDYHLDVVRAITAARRANVAVYTLSPGDVVGVAPEDDTGGGRALRELAQSEQALPALSAATGGFSSRGPQVLGAVDRVLRESSCYYLLGYYADPATHSPGALAAIRNTLWSSFRGLEVRTSRPGVRLTFRKGYWPAAAAVAADKGNDEDSPLAASVMGLIPDSSLPLRAQAVSFRGAKRGSHDLMVMVEVQTPVIIPATLGVSLEEEVELLAVAAEPGRGARASERVKTRVRIGTTPSGGAVAPRYLVCARLGLAPARYQLRLGVRSALAGQRGSVYVDLAVPDFDRESVSLSGVLLERRHAQQVVPAAASKAFLKVVAFTPALDRAFRPSDEVLGSVRVYRAVRGPDGPILLRTSIVRQGEATESWSVDEVKTATGFVERNGIDCRFRLPLERLSPGQYRLRVAAGGVGKAPQAIRELDFRVAGDEAQAETGPAATLPAAEFAALLDAANRYTEQYLERLSSVVSEETYEQAVSMIGTTKQVGAWHRTLRSDFLLVKVAGQPGLTPFRDVLEVDGNSVNDRKGRLEALFLSGRPDALDRARRVLDEGARYNLGHAYRNINHAVFPLVFLLPDARRRFTFEPRGDNVLAAGRGYRVDYRETSRPTIVRRGEGQHDDLPVSGSFWIEEGTGRVLGSVLRTGDRLFDMEVTALYRESPDLGLLVPAEMREFYKVGLERRELITGKATYGNFRRFQVATQENIKVR